MAVRPNGLDARGQHVSAYDEALFARQALAVPAFMHDESLRMFRFPLRPHRTRHHPRWVTLFTQNTMLWTFRGDLGGKIGWTTPARATFIGWARRGHTTLVVTILHCTPLTELTVASRLLSWGFAMDEISVASAGKSRARSTRPTPLFRGPSGLLSEPEPLGHLLEAQPSVCGRTRAHRIRMVGWRRRRRDYFIAENPRGETVWIYRDHRYGIDDGEWFLHGVFA